MSKKLLVIAPAVYRGMEPPIRHLVESCKRQGLELKLFGDQSHAYSTVGSDVLSHYQWGLRAVREADSLVVMFTDAADTFVTCGEEEILEKFKEYDSDVVYAAEQDVYPREWHNEYMNKIGKQYPTPWRAPNCGGWIGYQEKLVEVLALMGMPKYADINEAQPRFIRAWLDGHLEDVKITLDWQCSIFQTMSGSLGGSLDMFEGMDRPRNSWTFRQPCLIHFNGRTGQDGGQEEWYRRMYKTSR